MGLQVGSNPMSMDAIAALLVERFAGELDDVRIQEPDTVVARCARAKLKDVAARLKADADAGYETLNWVAGVDRGTALRERLPRVLLEDEHLHRAPRRAPAREARGRHV